MPPLQINATIIHVGIIRIQKFQKGKGDYPPPYTPPPGHRYTNGQISDGPAFPF